MRENNFKEFKQLSKNVGTLCIIVFQMQYLLKDFSQDNSSALKPEILSKIARRRFVGFAYICLLFTSKKAYELKKENAAYSENSRYKLQCVSLVLSIFLR